MNETTNGDKPTSNNGDQPPLYRLVQAAAIPLLLLGLFAALRSQWIQEITGFTIDSDESIRAQFWLALAFLGIALWLRYLLESGETAVAFISQTRASSLIEKKLKGARGLKRLLDDRDQSFRTIRTASHLVLATSIAVSMLFIGRGVQTLLARWFPDTNERNLAGVAYVLAFLFAGCLMLIVGEMLARSVASADPEKCALKRSWFLLLVRNLLSWPVGIVGKIASWVSLLFRVKPYTSVPTITEDQLRTLLETSETQGQLEEEEREMIHSVFDFGDAIVREVMTPRTDMDTVSIDAGIEKVADLVTATGHSRIPIYKDTVDQIVGVVHAKDLLQCMNGHEKKTIEEIMRPVYVIPENKKLAELLSEFRSGRNQMAIVQDEYGGTSGLVTIEDVVEEIVGEIVDEYDEEQPMWSITDDGAFVFDGKMNLDDVNDLLGSDLDSEEFDTIGGYVFGLIGHQPSPGEVVEAEGWQFHVDETDGRRVQKVCVRRIPEQEESATGQEQEA